MRNPLVILGACVLLAPRAPAQTVIAPVHDATLYAESGALANGSGSFLFAGQNAQSNARRALLRFDLASHVPSNATITSVALVVHVSQGNAGAATHTLHRVLADWGEGASDAPGSEGGGTSALAGDATWTERFTGAAAPWSTMGGEFDPAPSATLAIDGPGTWVSASSATLVAEAQAMLAAPATDFGWILVGDESSPSTSKRFDSRENADPAARPRLVVDYALPCGSVVAHCTATPNSAGPQGAHLQSGGTTSVHANDFTLIATGLPPASTCLFFGGAPSAGVPFGDGVRCIGGSQMRLGLLPTGTGAAQRTLDFTTDPAAAIAPGSTWSFQCWYRDAAAGGAGFNLSDALAVAFCP